MGSSVRYRLSLDMCHALIRNNFKLEIAGGRLRTLPWKLVDSHGRKPGSEKLSL